MAYKRIRNKDSRGNTVSAETASESVMMGNGQNLENYMKGLTPSGGGIPEGGFNRSLFEAIGAEWHSESIAEDGTTGAYWYNGLTDITIAQMADIYEATPLIYYQTALKLNDIDNYGEAFTGYSARTFRPLIQQNSFGAFIGRIAKIDLFGAYNSCPKVEKIKIFRGSVDSLSIASLNGAFFRCTKLREIIDELDLSYCTDTENAFFGCDNLESVKIKGLKVNLSFSKSPNLTVADDGVSSLAYLVANKGNQTPIEVTLHKDAFAKVPQSLKEKATAAKISLISK